MDLVEYKRVPDDEKWEPSLPSIASEEAADFEDTTPMLSDQKDGRKRPWLRSPLFYVFDVLLLASCLILVLRSRPHRSLDCQGDVTGYVPSFPQEIVTFRSHPEFISNHTSEASLAETQEHWKKLVPRKFNFASLCLS